MAAPAHFLMVLTFHQTPRFTGFDATIREHVAAAAHAQGLSLPGGMPAFGTPEDRDAAAAGIAADLASLGEDVSRMAIVTFGGEAAWAFSPDVTFYRADGLAPLGGYFDAVALMSPSS